jgi:hypothetical protein
MESKIMNPKALPWLDLMRLLIIILKCPLFKTVKSQVNEKS